VVRVAFLWGRKVHAIWGWNCRTICSELLWSMLYYTGLGLDSPQISLLYFVLLVVSCQIHVILLILLRTYVPLYAMEHKCLQTYLGTKELQVLIMQLRIEIWWILLCELPHMWLLQLILKLSLNDRFLKMPTSLL
jgi:hypothetical protein